MKNENISVKKGISINPNSQLAYASSVGLGEDENEIRLIFINKRLVEEDDELRLINESNLQVVLNKKTGKELKDLLDYYFD